MASAISARTTNRSSASSTPSASTAFASAATPPTDALHGRLPDEEKLDLGVDDSLFGFVQAAGVKVIYCLRLHNGDPQADAQTVKYIMDHYASSVDCFSIGQEIRARLSRG